MRKKNKTIIEDVQCLERSEAKSNCVKNVKVLGIHSKNGRVYPLSVMRDALPKYENIVVNLDHKPNEPRSVMDRFGKISNVRLEQDGIYGDLEYNPAHPYAKAFEYFVANQPDAVGLSHAAIAKTRMDNKTGIETVENIAELESVDLVATAATNKSLFESYTKILESNMKKDSDDMDKKEEAVQVLPGKHVYIPEEFMKKEFETYEAYCAGMREAIHGVMAAEMSHDDKCEALIGLMLPKDLDMKEEAVDKAINVLDEAEDKDNDDMDAEMKKMKAEEGLRKSGTFGHKLLIEELDRFRIHDKQVKMLDKVHSFCKDNGLDKKLVTETFIDILCNTNESKWKILVEDRKSLAVASKSPISVSADVATGVQDLTVDQLVKLLRS